MKEVEQIIRESKSREPIVDIKYDVLEVGDIVRVKHKVLGGSYRIVGEIRNG